MWLKLVSSGKALTEATSSGKALIEAAVTGGRPRARNRDSGSCRSFKHENDYLKPVEKLTIKKKICATHEVITLHQFTSV
jgi:hypothetical protein